MNADRRGLFGRELLSFEFDQTSPNTGKCIGGRAAFIPYLCSSAFIRGCFIPFSTLLAALPGYQINAQVACLLDGCDNRDRWILKPLHLETRVMQRMALWMVVATLLAAGEAVGEEYLTGIKWQQPPIVNPGQSDPAPPSDAVVLFDGTDASHWRNGENWGVKDGCLISGRGMIVSKETFGDCQVHVEWSAPTPAKGSGQGRGNSGIFLMGRYEMQVLDSFENETYFDGQAAAIYKQTPPMVNSMRPPGEWNSYDIIWTCPKFDDDGNLEEPAYITALHNGVLVLNHFALLGDTPYNRPPRYEDIGPKGPISIQDHGNPVRFRNIWVREYKAVVGERERPPYLRDGDKETPIETDAREVESERPQRLRATNRRSIGRTENLDE